MAKCHPANLCLCLALSQKWKEWPTLKNSACNHTLLNQQNKKFQFLMAGILSDLASSNNAATNGLNGRIGYKTWCKCKCCAPTETSTEGVCCLEIPEICKRRFSNRSCLNVCRLDPYFEVWYSRRENVVSYLISTQCWSLANQNKSFLALKTSWLSFSVKRGLHWQIYSTLSLAPILSAIITNKISM